MLAIACGCRPHPAFWVEVKALVEDGVSFTKAKVDEKRGGGGAAAAGGEDKKPVGTAAICRRLCGFGVVSFF